jgi:hypothetical protein
MTKISVEVTGLSQFVKAIKQVDPEHAKELRKNLNRAAEVVVREARPRVPRISGRAASTVKARSTQKAARVVGGGNRAPYYGWLDFGGWAGTNKKMFRPIIQEGRYIYVAYHENEQEFFDEAVMGLRIAAARAGLKVT